MGGIVMLKNFDFKFTVAITRDLYRGCIDNSKLLEWNQPDIQSFAGNLFCYAILRD